MKNTTVYLVQCHSVCVASKIGRVSGLRKLQPYRSIFEQCRRDQLAAILRRMRRDGLTRQAVRTNHTENVVPYAGSVGRVDIEAELDLFGEVVKPAHRSAEFETRNENQNSLFSKAGLPGQKNLFADVGVPDDMTPQTGTKQ